MLVVATLAVLVTDVCVVTSAAVVVMVTVALVDAATIPRLAVTVPLLAEQLAVPSTVQDTKVTLEGRESVTTTFCASELPVF